MMDLVDSTPAQFFELEDVTQFNVFNQTYFIDEAGKRHNVYILPTLHLLAAAD